LLLLLPFHNQAWLLNYIAHCVESSMENWHVSICCILCFLFSIKLCLILFLEAID
jgi:hypothetical protein